jgi:hypothetical protein
MNVASIPKIRAPQDPPWTYVLNTKTQNVTKRQRDTELDEVNKGIKILTAKLQELKY